MNILVDTSVWSLALRRNQPAVSPFVDELHRLIQEGRVVLLGVIRQELLSGIRSAEQFASLQQHLRVFPDEPLMIEDYEEAARAFNRCRARGVQGSNTDFLLCAVALRRAVPILTTDQGFERFATVLPFQLHQPRPR